jgi:hypothetical protein
MQWMRLRDSFLKLLPIWALPRLKDLRMQPLNGCRCYDHGWHWPRQRIYHLVVAKLRPQAGPKQSETVLYRGGPLGGLVSLRCFRDPHSRVLPTSSEEVGILSSAPSNVALCSRAGRGPWSVVSLANRLASALPSSLKPLPPVARPSRAPSFFLPCVPSCRSSVDVCPVPGCPRPLFKSAEVVPPSVSSAEV